MVCPMKPVKPGQLQEGLLYELMKSPAVSAVHIQSYSANCYQELCLAAKNEERKRRQ